MPSSRRTSLIRFALLPFMLSMGQGVYAKSAQERPAKEAPEETLNVNAEEKPKKPKKSAKAKADGVSSASQRRAARKARREKQQEK